MSIYLDYQATTPFAPEAKAAMLAWFDGAGNPHSAHKFGRAAKAAVDVARDQVATLMPPGGQLYFTSGATEALNWAIRSTPKGRIVTLATEHPAVLNTALALQKTHEVIVLPVQHDGLVNLEAARQAIIPGTVLVAAMLVNNEIGVIQPVDALAEMVHAAGARFLCDAVQGYGRVPLPHKADYIAVTAHKVHGPIGVGALWVRNGASLSPLITGGSQELGQRAGTLSPLLCAGFGAAAAQMAARKDVDAAHIARLATQLRAALGDKWALNGSAEARYQGNLNLRRDGLDVARLMSDVRSVMFSAGSACASGSGKPSAVLRALGLSDAQARSSIRLGFGRYTTEDDVAQAAFSINQAAIQQGL